MQLLPPVRCQSQRMSFYAFCGCQTSYFPSFSLIFTIFNFLKLDIYREPYNSNCLSRLHMMHTHTCTQIFIMVQLSFINFFKKTVPGHIFRGKVRLVRKVTLKDMQYQIGCFQQQERNMTLLRKPYLTLVICT